MYRLLFRLVLQRIDPERAHALAVSVLRSVVAIAPLRAIFQRILGPQDDGLRVYALGSDFPTPLGAAAGMDKDGTWFEELCTLGFGFVEVGTVTASPQAGNSGLRLSRLPRDCALVNRMGFPSTGADAVARRFAGSRRCAAVGVNVGKTRLAPLDDAGADYRESVRVLAPHADYLVLNVSSPNTPGLRDLQAEPDRLVSLVHEVRKELGDGSDPLPLLLKIGPDLQDSEIDAIADHAMELRLDGIVAVNTTVIPTGLKSDANEVEAAGEGALSGAPLKARGLEVLQRLYERAGHRLVLISVGGIETPEDAWERILAGATLVQAYTAFVYGGPLWPYRMNRGLARLLRDSGQPSLQMAIGTASSRGPVGTDLTSPHQREPVLTAARHTDIGAGTPIDRSKTAHP